ncbi:3-ketoacyl-ACP reductase [Rhodoferax saidenbachensis]|uniref:NAD(P)-dependent dehydrogenase (Short-subunit alcohol dehydrogenase family) n=1 Tax=Rhodoferax saidenbachensis TaxID=1484693 RepID=A0ABU1ZH10_9BURK|nr:3-ketoacyl-ACP reductase [Rhodoferax saidenbachensis]MDR7304830.1 NAD(P)-dependent dehydrogenase (short-subunit alcohol dehydrogenase family) [Rhodoferax saidenbachensis]
MTADTSNRPVALVTGAQRGIGRAIALQMAQAGFDVALCDRMLSDELHAAAAEVAELGVRSTAVCFDLADTSTHAAMLDAAEAVLGPVTCLVNNAGVSVLSRGDLLDVTPQAYDHCQDINTRGTFFLMQAFARRLLVRPQHPHHRSMVTITSSNAQAVSIQRGEYCVSKAALSMVSSLFAVRLGGEGIGVYEVVPGLIETEMSLTSKARYDADIQRGWLVVPRWGQAHEVGKVVSTLALGLLPYTVGQAIRVDGGMLINKY